MKLQSYNGNEFIKRSGVPIQWTATDLEEYIKCKQDVVYFATKYCKVIHPDLGVTLYQPREYQTELMHAMQNNRFVAASFGRQTGKTETIGIYLLHMALFNKAKRILIASNQKDGAVEVLTRIKTVFELLPPFLQQGVKRWNEGDILLENRSLIKTTATTKNAGRGKSPSAIYVDEVAFVENWAAFWDSIYPSISAGKQTQVLLSSTPRGMNSWYKIVMDAKQKKNEFTLVEARWNRVPGRDEEWKRKEIANSSLELFRQNHMLEFLGSSGTLISGMKLEELTWHEPTELDTQFNVRTYEFPKKNHKYVITVDVSRGSGIDSTAFSIIDVSFQPYRQVVVMNNNEIFPHEVAELVYTYAKRYNDAWVLVENNDAGGQVSDNLYLELDYPNVLFSETMGRDGLILCFGGGRAKTGINTNKRTKRIGCVALKNLVEGNQLVLHDQQTIYELMNFIRIKDSYQADPTITNSHDDMVMTLVLFGLLTDSKIFVELGGNGFKKPSRYEDEEAYIFDASKIEDSKRGWNAIQPDESDQDTGIVW